MRLRIIGVGRLRDQEIETLCAEYLRRSVRMIPIERVECRDLESAWRRAGADAFSIVALDERGDMLSTDELAAFVATHRDRGSRGLSFVIGDAYGIPSARRHQAARQMSLSKLTLPHRLALLLVCEQLYRVGTLLAGHPYHHR